MKTLDEQIAEQEAKIEHHKGVLERYATSRWYDQSRRYGETLKAELAVLIAERDQQPNALMGELVDPAGREPVAERRVGSSPTKRTN